MRAETQRTETARVLDMNAVADGRPITERMWGRTVPCVRVDPVDGAWADEVTLTLRDLMTALALPGTCPLTMRVLRCGGADVVAYGSSADGRPTMVAADDGVLMTGPLCVIGLRGRLTEETTEAILATVHAGWWADGDTVRATARVRGSA